MCIRDRPTSGEQLYARTVVCRTTGRLSGPFEKGFGHRAAAHHVGVGVDPVRALFRQFLLHGKLCLVEKPSKQQYSFEVKRKLSNDISPASQR